MAQSAFRRPAVSDKPIRMAGYCVRVVKRDEAFMAHYREWREVKLQLDGRTGSIKMSPAEAVYPNALIASEV
jgi:hypothetical protein